MELIFIVRDQEVEGSNPFAPTIYLRYSKYLTLNRRSLTVQNPFLFGLRFGLHDPASEMAIEWAWSAGSGSTRTIRASRRATRPCSPRFLAEDAVVQISVELPFDEAVIDFGGGNFASDMRVTRRVGVDVLEPFVDADDSRGFVQFVEERLPTVVFGVLVPSVEG
jgi:hypothetical protein